MATATAPKKATAPAASKPVSTSPAAPRDKVGSFKSIAGRRANNILKQLDLLGNCANKNSYTYTPEQVSKIFDALSEKYDTVRAKFDTTVKTDVKKLEL